MRRIRTESIGERSRPQRARRRPRGGGFTVIEMLVGLLLSTALLVAVLNLFDLNSKIARVQTQVADLQNSVRIAQYDLVRNVRAAGRGGLPAALLPAPAVAPPFAGRLLPAGVALEVRNDTPADTTIGGIATPNARVLEGTDVLVARGVFTTPIYQVDPPDFDLRSGRARVNALAPSGVPQDLSALREAVDRANGGDPEALLAVSPLGPNLYAVVELTGGAFQLDLTDPTGRRAVQVTLNFAVTGGMRTADYARLSPEGRFPPQMTSAAFVGVLEEYRYYVSEQRAVAGDASSELVPRLSRARFYPGTETVHPQIPSAREDIADNILDLQASLGVDNDGDGLVSEGTTAAQRAVDEWLFNDGGDQEDDPNDPARWRWNGNNVVAAFLRINVLAQADRPDPTYLAPPIDAIEDRVYGEPEVPADEAGRRARMARRRLLQTVVELRNL